LVSTPRDASGPPRWLALLTWAALAALLYYPVHFPYQHPDQDHPALTLLELVRGGWEPWTIHYPALLNNVLRESRLTRAVISGGDSSSHAASVLGVYALTAVAPIAPGSPPVRRMCRFS